MTDNEKHMHVLRTLSERIEAYKKDTVSWLEAHNYATADATMKAMAEAHAHRKHLLSLENNILCYAKSVRGYLEKDNNNYITDAAIVMSQLMEARDKLKALVDRLYKTCT